jgi:single-stranded DNA-binding protein
MNVLTVTGRLTTDPVRRDTAKGVVCELALAVDGRPRLWLPVEMWGQLAGRCAQHLHSGRRVAVSGPLLCQEYVTRAGERATRWLCRANSVTFLDRPDEARAELEVAR